MEPGNNFALFSNFCCNYLRTCSVRVKPESFWLEYNVPCNPDLPFKLSIGGISTPGQTNFVTTVVYKPAKIVRAEFRLPY
jgi:hypothetical protein